MNERKQGDVQWRPHVHVRGGCQHYEDACAIHGGPQRIISRLMWRGQKGLFCTREFGDDSYIFEQIY